MSRRGTRSAGQSGTEMIVILILVAFAAVAVVTIYGRHVGKKFSCAGQSVGNGGGAAPGCSGEEPNGAGGGGDVDAVSGAGPRVASSRSGTGAAGGDAAQKRSAASGSGGAARNARDDASRDGEVLPVLPTPRGGSDAVPVGAAEPPADTAVAANAPAPSSSGRGSGSAASGSAREGKQEPTEDLSDFLKPGGGPASDGLQQLASQPPAAALPPVGSGSGSAAGGAARSGDGQPVLIDNPSPAFQGDGSSGGGSAAPQVLRDTLVGPADGLPFPGSSGVSKAQVNEFVLGGTLDRRLNDAASDLRNKTSGGEGVVSGIVDRGTIVEVKGADGSTNLFRVENPFKEVRDTRFGRVPEIGAVRDRSRVVVEAVGPGEKVDPKAPRIVVSDQQTTGEIALELSRQAGRTGLERGEETTLDRTIRADERTRIEALRPKVRSEFVNDTVSDVANAAARDIQRKKELERQGAAISTKLPFETEHQDAFNRAFATELGKSDPKAALAAANEAGRRAVEEAVRRDKSVADRAGKAFDRKFAQFAREHPDQLTEAERRHRTDELIKGLAELVNKVDPDSPEADRVIELVDAIVPHLSGADRIRFVVAADKGLNRLLGPFGFRVVEGVDVGALQLDRLDYALGNFDALNPKQRDEVRRSPVAAARLGIRSDPTAAELRARDRLVAIRTLPDGTLHEGTLAEFRDAAERNRINHILGQLESIANAGPGALLGRIIDGERGAAIGAAIDAGLPIVASVKARADVRAGIQSFPSGGLVVTGGPGGAAFEPVSGPGVSAGDRLVPLPRTNAGEVGGDLVKRPETGPRQVTLKGAGPQPPRPPAPARPSSGNPPAQNPAGGTGGQGGNVGGARQGTQVSVVDVQRNNAARQRIEATRADRDRAIQTVSVNGRISVDRLLDRLEGGRGDGTLEVVISLNSNRHRQAFQEEAGNKLGPGEEPPPVFPDGNVIRVDPNRISADQRARLEAVASRPSEVEAPRAQPPPVDGHARTQPQVDPRAGTQPQVDVRADTVRLEAQSGQPSQRPRQVTRPGSGPQPPRQPAPPRPNPPAPQASRSDAPTGKILALRPQVAIEAAKPDGVTAGKFTNKDITFGLARVGKNPNALVEFSGQAEPGTSLKLDEAERGQNEGGSSSSQRAPARFNSLERGEQVAAKTIALTKKRLQASGGKLRFSLAGFSVEEALDPKASNFKQITSFEFRGVISDPFFSRRVHFFDKDGKDVTAETIEQARQILARGRRGR